jgi:predicted nucleotidyltransferase
MSEKINRLNQIFVKNEIQAAYLFGSQRDSGLRFLKGEKMRADDFSDLDIGLLLKTPPSHMYDFYGKIYCDLSAIFEPFSVDIVFLHEVNYFIKFEILKGHRIFSRDEEFVDAFEEQVTKFASDLSFKRRMFEAD